MKNKNFNISLIIFLGLFFLSILSSFINWNPNLQNINEKNLYLLILIKSICSSAIGLIIMSIGYTLNVEKLSKKYYFKLSKNLGFSIVAFLIFIVIKKILFLENVDIIETIMSILSFSLANEERPIYIFILLFLIVPYLNILYNSLESKKEKSVLIVVLIILTVFPNALNLTQYGINFMFFTSNWLLLYPVLFYYIGSYIKEFGIKINLYISGIAAILVVIGFSTLLYKITDGTSTFQYFLDVSSFPYSLCGFIGAIAIFLIILDYKFKINLKHRYIIEMIMPIIIVSITLETIFIYKVIGIDSFSLSFFYLFFNSLVATLISIFLCFAVYKLINKGSDAE